MIEQTWPQKISIRFILIFLRVINFLNFELRWVLFSSLTVVLTLSLWNLKDSNLDEIMKMTRRKPVLSLLNTVPASIINNSTSEETQVLAKETLKPTQPAKKVLKIAPLNLQARSYLVYDFKNNVELASYNKNEKLPPASLVKLLSVMYFTKDLNLKNKYKMTGECSSVNGQKVGFKVGEEITVQDLVYSSLIYSGADAVCLLSRIDSNLDLNGFNNFAKNIGVNNSNFTNYIGLDFTDNYTTSEDMLTITKEFLKNKLFSEIVRLKSYELENKRVLYNTNKMLFSEKNSYGVKTGTTDGANENLIYRYKDDSRDLDLIVVILNSANRYSDTTKIINSIYFE